MKIVYNAEPYGYSEKARQHWIDKGFQYREGRWEEIDQNVSFLEVEVLIVRLKRVVSKQVLDKFPNLKVVVSATTGHDHLDENELRNRGIRLLSLRGHNEFLSTIPSTAEHTWGLIMSLMRNIPQAHNDVLNGNWNRDQFRGFQLQGKTLGVIGLGRTGRKVANYAKAFGMHINYFDPFVAAEEFKKCHILKELFETANIVSIHVHLKPETRNLVDRELLNICNGDIYVVNTSRAGLWDEEALVMALEKGRVSGVATDVLFNELDDIKESPLWEYAKSSRNVLITPHLGGATWDAMWACEEYLTKNI